MFAHAHVHVNTHGGASEQTHCPLCLPYLSLHLRVCEYLHVCASAPLRQTPLRRPKGREPKIELLAATVPAFISGIDKLFAGRFFCVPCENDFSLLKETTPCQSGAGERSDLRDAARGILAAGSPAAAAAAFLLTYVASHFKIPPSLLDKQSRPVRRFPVSCYSRELRLDF